MLFTASAQLHTGEKRTRRGGKCRRIERIDDSAFVNGRMPLPHCRNRRKQNNRARRRSKPETEQQIFRPLQPYFRPAAVRLRRKLTSNISEHAEQKAFKCAQRSIYPARSNYYRRNAHRSKHGRRRCNDVKYGFAKNDYSSPVCQFLILFRKFTGCPA